MSKTLNALVRARVRKIHAENVAISAQGDPAIQPGLRFKSGYKAPMPAPNDIGRRMRRRLERQMMKKIAKGGLR